MGKKEKCKYHDCKHYVICDSRSNWNGEEPTYIWGCDLRECKYEAKDNDTENRGKSNK